jgi:hypothetical protein
MGRGMRQRHDHRAGMEDEAELVPGRHRRQDDPPPAQHFMSDRAGSTVVEEKGSHAIYISKPEVVAAFIEKAAKGVKLAAN